MISRSAIAISNNDTCQSYLQKEVGTTEIIVTEALATVKHVLPSMLSWIWRKYICSEIKTIPLSVTMEKVTKVAYLNIHGDFNRSDLG